MFATITTTCLNYPSYSSSSSYTHITRFPFPFPPSPRIRGAPQHLRCSSALFSEYQLFYHGCTLKLQFLYGMQNLWASLNFDEIPLSTTSVADCLYSWALRFQYYRCFWFFCCFFLFLLGLDSSKLDFDCAFLDYVQYLLTDDFDFLSIIVLCLFTCWTAENRFAVCTSRNQWNILSEKFLDSLILSIFWLKWPYIVEYCTLMPGSNRECILVAIQIGQSQCIGFWEKTVART